MHKALRTKAKVLSQAHRHFLHSACATNLQLHLCGGICAACCHPQQVWLWHPASTLQPITIQAHKSLLSRNQTSTSVAHWDANAAESMTALELLQSRKQLRVVCKYACETAGLAMPMWPFQGDLGQTMPVTPLIAGRTWNQACWHQTREAAGPAGLSWWCARA